MKRLSRDLLVFLYGVIGLAILPLQASPVEIRIGVLAYEGIAQALPRWQPTAEYLNQRILGYRFSIVPLSHDEIDQALFKHKLHFVLTNPGHYVRLERKYGITRLVTFKSAYQQQTLNRFGAVIVVPADSAIRDLSNLEGKRFAGVSEQAFGGYLMALREFKLAGENIAQRIRFTWLGFPQKDILRAVLEGSVDAGTVRSGVLEKMIDDGELQADELRVIAPKQHSNFPLRVSTELYPEWPFAAAPETAQDISEALALALLSMPADAPAAAASRGVGWTIPADYSAVHELYRFLELPPYPPRTADLNSVWREYRDWIMFTVALFLITLVVMYYLFKTNLALSHSRINLARQQGQLEQTVESRTLELKELNRQLERDNNLIARKEAGYRDVCDTLSAMTQTSTRRDLSHQQRLQSIVDIGGYHMNARRVVLSSSIDDGVKVCAVSPIDEGLTGGAIHPELAEKALQLSETQRQADFEPGMDYLACPVTSGEQLGCVIELIVPGEAENSSHDIQDLKSQTLQLILQWAANELLHMQQEERVAELRAGDSEKFTSISKRERQVLQLMARGLSSKAIARDLKISVKTVELHRGNLLRKTGMQSSLEMVKTAARAGIVA